ncbi:hypothetical protein [Aquimarina aquimarini]|uniref:hypothetical protein n=1 Tax=Aquimarina aquimarini TaxID=1191734 RepID=UPI00131EFB37|nr:hypothetical protein [Aquimarina aquimarini]
MRRVFFLIGIMLLMQSCLVSRLSRPKLTGYIYAKDSKQPIEKCKVGESYTDAWGYYELSEKRYREITFIGNEAPPVFVQELIFKKGYVTDTIKAFNRYGGAARKNTHWKIDTIFLKSK